LPLRSFRSTSAASSEFGFAAACDWSTVRMLVGSALPPGPTPRLPGGSSFGASRASNA